MRLSSIQKLFVAGLGIVVVYMFFAGLNAILERRELCDALSDIQRALPESERERLEMDFVDAYYGRCE